MRFILLTLLTILPLTSTAAGSSDSLIKGYVVAPGASNAVGLYIIPDASIANAAACNVTNRFIIDANSAFGKTILAVILAAIQSDTPLKLYGSGACNSGLSTNAELLVKACIRDVPC